MEDKNCGLLFEYLRSILYDAQIKPLDLKQLDEPYQKLGMGLQYLDKAVQEMKAYSEALSKGRLSDGTPARDNFLCENLKNIHANLNHLTWQAKQVAKGDYSQTVSYLGEFSEAFNAMTRQLKEREQRLKEEAEKEKKRVGIMENYNQLLMELIARSDEEILVVRKEDQKILYSNENAGIQISPEEVYELCKKQLEEQSCHGAEYPESYEWTWEAQDTSGHYYRITTGYIRWQGEQAYLHIIREVTDEKNREAQLEAEAYLDQLTGVGNRHYFTKKAEELLETGDQLIFGYCDLDHLKYINDKYGHLEGDWYIRYFTDIVNRSIRHEDIFARLGGDEFCMILKNCEKENAEWKLQRMQSIFRREKNHPYPKNFSYGIIEVSKNGKRMTVEEIIRMADEMMYSQKRKHKEEEQIG